MRAETKRNGELRSTADGDALHSSVRGIERGNWWNSTNESFDDFLTAQGRRLESELPQRGLELLRRLAVDHGESLCLGESSMFDVGN
jgi:hypothetical protein